MAIRSPKVWVDVDGRRFIVNFDKAGEPSYIRERKPYGGYPIEGVYDAPYWHKSHGLGKGATMPKRILEAAKAKRAAS